MNAGARPWPHDLLEPAVLALQRGNRVRGYVRRTAVAGDAPTTAQASPRNELPSSVQPPTCAAGRDEVDEGVRQERGECCQAVTLRCVTRASDAARSPPQDRLPSVAQSRIVRIPQPREGRPWRA